jgi:hypothetical protein
MKNRVRILTLVSSTLIGRSVAFPASLIDVMTAFFVNVNFIISYNLKTISIKHLGYI